MISVCVSNDSTNEPVWNKAAAYVESGLERVVSSVAGTSIAIETRHFLKLTAFSTPKSLDDFVQLFGRDWFAQKIVGFDWLDDLADG